MAAKSLTEEYVVDLCRRIGEGEAPKKDTEISAKEFTRRMMPHVKGFLDKGYTYKEIAAFFGHVSAADLKKAAAKADLKKAVAKDVPENKPEKKADTKEPAKPAFVESPAKPAAKDVQTKQGATV